MHNNLALYLLSWEILGTWESYTAIFTLSLKGNQILDQSLWKFSHIQPLSSAGDRHEQ